MLMHESLAAYRQGRLQVARDLAVAAYLDGFELIEAALDTVDRRLRLSIEAKMLAYRGLLKQGQALPSVEAAALEIQGLLAEAQQRLAVTRLPPSATFLSAFIILLREGLEAILVLAAIFALLIKAERRDALPYVHAGWIAAMAGGLLSAAVTLALLGWLIFRGSLRLPLGLFFGATSWLLALLAVVFVGKGIAALQEAGKLPVSPLNIPSLPTLGLHPNLQVLVVQVLVVIAIASMFAYTRYRAQATR
jgi:high-affinity Fe2+/Pb2+ permease